MDDNIADTCPICYSEYTSDAIHRPTSLKCGHIFGYQCLIHWSRQKGHLLCPTCSTKNRKQDIRVLYGTSIKVSDVNQQNDVLQKFLDEKSKNEQLQHENLHLKTCIDYLQDEIKRVEEKILDNIGNMKDNEKKINNFDYVLKDTYKDKNFYPIVIDDTMQRKLFISARDATTTGYKIFDYNNFEHKYIKLFNKEKEAPFVSDIKLSPFCDGLLAVVYHKKIKLLNSITENILTVIENENLIKVICFDAKNREKIFFGDIKGNLNEYDLIEKETKLRFNLGKALYFIEYYNEKLFISSILNVYCYLLKEDKFHNIEFYIDYRCCSIRKFEENLLIVYKSPKNIITHQILSEKKDTSDLNENFIDNFDLKIFETNNIQFMRKLDKIHNEKIFVIDDFTNSLNIYCIVSKRKIKSISTNFRILDFVVNENYLIVLTENFILIYD
ncbi:RING finger and WD repeat domain-containing protein 3 [Gurleya vavrai]